VPGHPAHAGGLLLRPMEQSRRSVILS